MSWQLIVLTRVLSAHIVIPIMMKKLTSSPSRARKIVLQFGACAVFSTLLVLITGENIATPTTLLVALVGVANSFGAYSHWRAVDISLSKTALFTQFDDILSIALGFIFLGEHKMLTPSLITGIALCIGAAIAFSVFGKKDNSVQNADKTKEMFMWISFYSVIWGVAVFIMRYLALNKISLPHFLFSWYGGSFLGTLIIYQLVSQKERGDKLDMKATRDVVVYAALIWVCMVLSYLALTKAPIAVVQPIFQVTEMVFPAIIGLWIFKEAKSLSVAEKATFATGLCGVSLILCIF